MSAVVPSPEMIRMMAARFKALGEPARLQLVYSLRSRELSVNELVDATGLNQANVSKHLQVLHALRFVKRRKEGLFVYYTLNDRLVLSLCNSVGRHIDAHLQSLVGQVGERADAPRIHHSTT